MMRIIDNADIKGQLAYLSTVAEDSPAAECVLAPDAKGTVVTQARRMQEEGGEGVILLESPRSFFVVGPRPANLSLAGCAVTQVNTATVGERLKRAAGGSRSSAHSVLYRHRAARQKNTVMVADDDALICETLGKALEKFGPVVTVQDPAKVVQAYIDTSPDCLFLDLHFGEKSGLDMIDDIVGLDRDAHIVMLTIDNKATAAAAAKQHGAKSFIAKPFDMTRIEYELSRSPTFRRYAI